MKKVTSIGIFIVLVILFLWIGGILSEPQNEISPLAKKYKKPLDQYTFSALKKRSYLGSAMQIGKKRKETSVFVSYMFYFISDGKKVSGFITIPKNTTKAAVIVLLRGFVDKTIYTTGIGSEPVGEALASNGFIVISPDFLGYGESDKPSKNPLEERFQTYTIVLNLLVSLQTLNTALIHQHVPIQAETQKIGIWAHSNGGHIALSVLAISGKNYPTVLWAPVSKPFPYSILYYTDDSDDHGRAMRKLVAQFETEYDAELYSPPNYLAWVKAPIQLHQGTRDEAVPQSWSDNLYTALKQSKVPVDYFTYDGADHNLMPQGWSSAVEKMVPFYREKLNL